MFIEAGEKDAVNRVLANVLEKEASFDVDLHEDIVDQDSEVRGTCGWRVCYCFHRLQINLRVIF